MRTVHIAPWLKTALHASSHPCMCTCVLRCDCFLFTRLRPLLRSTALLPALPDVFLRVPREVQVQPPVRLPFGDRGHFRPRDTPHSERGTSPLRLRLFLVRTASAVAIFMSSKPWTACSAIIRFNTALNNPPCRSTLPLCSGLSTPAWRIRTPCWASVRAKTPRCGRHDHNSRSVANQPNRPTN